MIIASRDIIDQRYLASVWILDVLLRLTWPSNCNQVVGLSLLAQRATHTLLSEDIFFYIHPYTPMTIFNTWLLGLSPDLRVYCKIFQYLLTFCLNSMETSNPLSSMWQKIDRFILQMYNFPSLSLDTLDYIPQVHLLFQS